MSDIKLNDFVDKHLNSMSVITGFPRSGTSILGKLVGTFESVEYAFEPPMLAYLDATQHFETLSADNMRELLSVYLYYDYFSNQIHGRRLNFRPGDMSNILSMKSFKNVVEKWNSVDGIQDTLERVSEQNPQFVMKFPAIYRLLGCLDDIRVIHIKRDLDRVLASLMAKEWFTDENLGTDSTGVWPFHDTEETPLVPYLVPEHFIERWQSLNAASRTVLFCVVLLRLYEQFLEDYNQSDDYLMEVRYDSFLHETERVVDELTTYLDVDRGNKTNEVLDEVAPTMPDYGVERIFDRAEPQLVEEFEDVRERAWM